MLSWSSFRMAHQKMMQNMEELQNMLLVAASLRQSNVVNDHISNDRAALIAGQEALSQRCSGDFGQMVMLGDRKYLLLGQAA
jgi:hypothetical protein